VPGAVSCATVVATTNPAQEALVTPSLFSTYRLARLDLPNRVLMAPMTRNRAGATGIPTQLNAEYYGQRAGAGLIISEGTQPSPSGQGYPGTPGIHNDLQQAGWARVADAVHRTGGRIFVQLMHAGRISHTAILPGGAQPVAPSALRPAGELFTGEGTEPFGTPRALERDELAGIASDFAQAARRAVAAGADGVELHAANGYLLHQFLSEAVNRRDDDYGGPVSNRIRLVVETAAAVAEVVGGQRVGVRISPANPFNDMAEPDAEAVYPALLRALGPLGLAYLHTVESPPGAGFSSIDLARLHWAGPLIANSGGWELWGGEHAQALLDSGRADMVSFGRHFLANPDLPERLRLGTHLNEADPATFYGGDGRGYVDYPTLRKAASR
jgi:N-ethylmaleimide reductase